MNIQDVYIKNFLSFHGEHSFYYPNRGLTLIVGYNYDSVDAKDDADVLSSNGSGKSAICVAPLWCMYGIIDRDLDKKDDVVNREAGTDCVVRANIDAITIERGRNPNYLRLWVAGEEQTKGTMGETQKAINKLLNMDSDTFRNMFILSGDTISSFMKNFKGQRREFIEKLFGLHLYDAYRDYAREKEKDLQKILFKDDVKLKLIK